LGKVEKIFTGTKEIPLPPLTLSEASQQTQKAINDAIANDVANQVAQIDKGVAAGTATAQGGDLMARMQEVGLPPEIAIEPFKTSPISPELQDAWTRECPLTATCCTVR